MIEKENGYHYIDILCFRYSDKIHKNDSFLDRLLSLLH